MNLKKLLILIGLTACCAAGAAAAPAAPTLDNTMTTEFSVRVLV